jgi:GH15 family glucan-1,4-alpha-glucosidase
MSPRHVYPYGIIGNCAYSAHIDDRANVAWMCWPRFDSSFIFGSMVAGDDLGGRFFVQPAADHFTSRQYYLENTNVLCTEFTAADGSFRVVDCAPRFRQYERYFKPLMLVRKIEPIAGSPRIRVSCRPMGDYGRNPARAQLGSNHIRYLDVGPNTRLTADLPLNHILDERPFVLTSTRHLVLSWGPPLEAPLATTSEEFIRNTIHYWRETSTRAW